MIKFGIGQDSHRFESPKTKKPLRLGGVRFPGVAALAGNSDADVVLHAVTNAISGVTGKPVLGAVSDAMCKKGVTDSRKYLERALADLNKMRYGVTHVSISIECRKPRLLRKIEAMKQNIAGILGVNHSDVAVTATSGEQLTDFGRGLGIQAFAAVTASKF